MSLTTDPLFVKAEVAYRQERYSGANARRSGTGPARLRWAPQWFSHRRHHGVRAV